MTRQVQQLKAAAFVVFFVRRNHNRQMLPMNKVFAFHMAPVDRTRLYFKRVVLVKHMIFPIPLDQPVRVIDPADRIQNMVSEPVRAVCCFFDIFFDSVAVC
jgi:hypothetical protein